LTRPRIEIVRRRFVGMKWCRLVAIAASIFGRICAARPAQCAACDPEGDGEDASLLSRRVDPRRGSAVVLVESAAADGAGTMSFVEWARRFARRGNATQFRDTSVVISEVVPFLELEPSPPLKPLPLRSTPRSPMTSSSCAAFGDGVFTGKRKAPVKVIDVSVMGFDLDVLEMKFHELRDEVDLFFVIEMPWSLKGVKRPLMWRRNVDKPRFSIFKDKVVSIVVPELPKGSEPQKTASSNTSFTIEHWQEHEGMVLVRSELEARGMKQGDVVMLFGDADEIAAPHLLHLMRHCEPKALPVDVGTWMPMGLMTRAFRTDWPVDRGDPSVAFTFGNPAFHDPFARKEAGGAWRTFGGSGLYVLGGWHLTNYLYPPARLIKTLSMPSYAGHIDASDMHLLGQDVPGYFEKGKDSWAPSRFKNTSELLRVEPYRSRPELLQPPAIMIRNPERYGMWYGKLDSRVDEHIPWGTSHW